MCIRIIYIYIYIYKVPSDDSNLFDHNCNMYYLVNYTMSTSSTATWKRLVCNMEVPCLQYGSEGRQGKRGKAREGEGRRGKAREGEGREGGGREGEGREGEGREAAQIQTDVQIQEIQPSKAVCHKHAP